MPTKLISQDARSQWQTQYRWARREHAWLLRAEGLKLREVGTRLGVSRSQARVLIFQFARDVSRRLERQQTRFRLDSPPGQ